MITAETTSGGIKYVPDYITFIPPAERCRGCENLFPLGNRLLCVFTTCHKEEADKDDSAIN